MTSRSVGEGYQLEWTGRVRDATEKPIVGVGGLTDPDRMADIIDSSTWDLVGAARPSIADPFFRGRSPTADPKRCASGSAARPASRSPRQADTSATAVDPKLPALGEWNASSIGGQPSSTGSRTWRSPARRKSRPMMSSSMEPTFVIVGNQIPLGNGRIERRHSRADSRR